MITLADVRAALALHPFDAPAAQARMFPGSRPPAIARRPTTRQAGVLVLLYPTESNLHLVLTRRADTLRGHSGQISFPGGRRDPTDQTFIDTALRETCEELGLCEQIEVLGDLAPLYIPPSDYEVFPAVGALAAAPAFNPNPHEVAQVFSVALADLLDPAYKRLEEWPLEGRLVPIPYYAFAGHKVWGATAIMLSELEARLLHVLEGPR